MKKLRWRRRSLLQRQRKAASTRRRCPLNRGARELPPPAPERPVLDPVHDAM